MIVDGRSVGYLSGTHVVQYTMLKAFEADKSWERLFKCSTACSLCLGASLMGGLYNCAASMHD